MKQVSYTLVAAVVLIWGLVGRVLGANIDPNNDDHQYAWGENFGWLNFQPSHGLGVTVGSSGVEGFVWAENIGWINLNPANAGVTNDGNGNLSGYAWSENIGWISFSCENTNSCSSVPFGLRISSDGKFTGQAWSENAGWINFDLGSETSYTVKTSWAPGRPAGNVIFNNGFE